MRSLLLTAFLLVAFFALAQDKQPERGTLQAKGYVQMCEIQLNSGEVYKGEVKEDTDSSMVLLLASKAEKRFDKRGVKHYNYYLAKSDFKFEKDPDQPHIAGCFYGATRNAFLFAPRKVEISSAGLVFYNYNYNVNRNVSVGLSTSLFLVPTLFHAKGHFQLAPKFFFGLEAAAGFSTPVDPVGIGGGAFKFTYGDYNGHVTTTLAFGSAFAGSLDYGFAYGIAGAKLLEGDVYAVGELWSARNLKGTVFTIGIRTLTRPRVSWLWGLGAVLGDVARNSYIRYVIPFPYFGFTFRT